MTVKKITTEVGHSLAPEGPHTVTFHFPGWDSIAAFRAGDPKVLGQMRSIYPRFGPWFEARKVRPSLTPYLPTQSTNTPQLVETIHAKLNLPASHNCLPFTDPSVFALAQEHAFSHHRKAEHKLAPSDLSFHVVDIGGVRLFVVAYPLAKTPGIIGIWQNPGFGVSTRLCEELLKHVDSLNVVPFEARGGDDVSLGNLPEPTYLPEGEAHQALRERIVSLLKRATAGEAEYGVTPGNVFLCPTGMAAIYQFYRAALKARKGAVVALGSIFHSTWHLFEEAPDGFKHFGPTGADSGVVGHLEEYIKGEKAAGRDISFVFVEFPSNPLLVSVDLKGLAELAREYDFPLVVDDTVGSFCNIDVLPVADVVISSLTKSFSGYANVSNPLFLPPLPYLTHLTHPPPLQVMGGSIIFNPSSPQYPLLSTTFAHTFHNALYTLDAATLLSNSTNYLSRSAILNRNASALATFIASQSRTNPEHPSSSVLSVLYPTHSDTLSNYQSFIRTSTPEFPEPGYGCLLSVDFATEKAARAFYEVLSFHKGPHLGAHETLVLNFNECVWGDDKELAAYQASFGARPEQVRISVGLEDVDVLVDTVKAALEVVEREGM